MMRGATPAAAPPTMRATRREPVASRAASRGDDQRRGAVVDAGGIARGDGAVLRGTASAASASASSVVSARGCSSLSTTTGSPLRCGISPARSPWPAARSPAPPRRAAGCAARTRPGRRARWRSLRHVLAGLGHRVDAVLLLHQRIDEAPADGGVVDLGVARERGFRLGQHERRAATSISTPPAIISSASPALMARAAMHHRVHAGAAQAVDGGARHATGSPASSSAMRATLRLSSPAWLAQPNITSSTACQSTRGMPRHQGLQRHGGEIVGAHAASAPP